MKLFLTLLLSFHSFNAFGSAFCTKYSDLNSQRVIIRSDWVERDLKGNGVVERVGPRYFVEERPVSEEMLVEICAPKASSVFEVLRKRRVTDSVVDSMTGGTESGDDEVFTLIENGPVKNRINLVFMGDGYLASEKEKFLTDMKRLTQQIFEGKTFSSYLPIFNVYAVFRASRESGIGKNDTPKDTAYKLYRQGNTLRAIFPGNGAAAHDSCSKAPACDYPILIANDEFYGGLGGEFSISTSSARSGMVVLRHELGHSVGLVGEEYDGGGYFGANHSYSATSLGWSHWTTEASPLVEPSQARNVSWPWKNLSKGKFTASMVSDGLWDSIFMTLSMSGLETDNDIAVKFDGVPLSVKGQGHSDRDFYDFTLDHGMNKGTHELTFEEGVHDENNWVSNITVHEFKKGYHFDPGYVGAYPLFAGSRAQGYRPTHNTCLMRNMKSDSFCPVCVENNWIKFFATVQMIDTVETKSEATGHRVTVRTQPLGQFRTAGASGSDRSGWHRGEHVFIRWYKDGVVQLPLNDQTEAVVTEPTSQWEVEVEFKTPEVRKDSAGVLKTRKTVVF